MASLTVSNPNPSIQGNYREQLLYVLCAVSFQGKIILSPSLLRQLIGVAGLDAELFSLENLKYLLIVNDKPYLCFV